jgi:hypothetical protein
MYAAALTLVLLSACWYALGRHLYRGGARGRHEMTFVTLFEAPAAIYGGGGLLLLALPFPCRGGDVNVSARAALSLATAARAKARPPQAVPLKAGRAGTCACLSPASCICRGSGDRVCECPRCTMRRPVTLKADDGGPDWRWDARREGYYRTVDSPRPAPVQAPAPPPVFQGGIFAPPPAFFRPAPPMVRGGGACRGGG